MPFDFVIGQNDRLPILQMKFLDPKTGQFITFAGTATFTMLRASDNTPVVSGGAITLTTDPVDSKTIFNYAWGAGDTATAGQYKGYVYAGSGATQQRLPMAGHVSILIDATTA